MFESDPSCFRLAQAGCQESLNALLQQHEGLVQAAVRRQVTGGTALEDLLALALLASYGLWAGLGAWTAQQTGGQRLPGLSPLPTGTPRPTATPGWWTSPLAVPTWEVPAWEGW